MSACVPRARVVVAFFVLSSLVGTDYLQGSGASAPLTMARYLEGKWTYQPSWSPDGRFVAFLWDDWVRQNIYVMPASGGRPVPVSNAENFIGNPSFGSAGEAPSWSPDSRYILYAQDGDLFLSFVPEGKVLQLTDTSGLESGARFSPDGQQVAYTRGGDLYLLDRSGGSTRQLTREQRGDGGISWSPDGKWIAFSSGPSTPVSWLPDYSGSLISYHWVKRGSRDVGVIASAGGPVRWIATSPDNESLFDWSPDSKSVLVERRSIDVKDRTLFGAARDGSSVKALYRQHDDKFLPGNDQHALFSPDGRWVAFTSDEDGWNHLYVLAVEGGAPRQITRGAFEVSFPSWTSKGDSLFFCSSEEGSEQRHLYTVSLSSGQRTRLAAPAGINTAAELAPSRDQVVYLHSDPTHLPDVWVSPLAAGGEARRLTDAMTQELLAYPWQTPQIVTYRSQVDGLPIKAQLFVPPGLDKRKKYPAIVHTHQAAIYQEVYLGPGPEKDNVLWYGFHQRLAQEGYLVLNVDYRGSYGYGRDFRVGDYMDLGGNDARDVVSGVEYLKTLGYVDINRLGVYGMSYGGHMVLSLLTKFPDVFKAGVDIAGVADFLLNYESLYGPWILGRLGTPDQNQDAYFKSSAINFIDQMKAPVLILHGTNDPNVTLLQSILLIDRLLEKGKRFEFEIYPGELHFFAKKRSWVDAFAKIERFFEEHVRKSRATGLGS